MIARIKNKDALTWPFKHRTDFISILSFSLLGMYLVQFTYFKTIELSSASFATIIQYIGPVFVIFYTALQTKMLPEKKNNLSHLTCFVGRHTNCRQRKASKFNRLTSGLSLGNWLGYFISLLFHSTTPATCRTRKHRSCWLGNAFRRYRRQHHPPDLES